MVSSPGDKSTHTGKTGKGFKMWIPAWDLWPQDVQLDPGVRFEVTVWHLSLVWFSRFSSCFQTQTPPSNTPDVWLVVELVGNFPWKTLFDWEHWIIKIKNFHRNVLPHFHQASLPVPGRFLIRGKTCSRIVNRLLAKTITWKKQTKTTKP